MALSPVQFRVRHTQKVGGISQKLWYI